MKKKTVESLINITRDIEKYTEILKEAGVHVNYIEGIGSKIHETILDDFGLPSDNTLQQEVIGDDWFCRDLWYDILYKYEDGEISLDEFYERMQNWEKEIDKLDQQ